MAWKNHLILRKERKRKLDIKAVIEAIIFASGVPIKKKDIIDKVSLLTSKEFDECIKQLKEKYNTDCGVVLMQMNDGFQFVSNAKFGEQVAEVLTPLKEKALSKSLLEVLSIVAYKQPVTRLDIEEIRGVSSEYAISMLVKFELIDVVGRKDVVGRPLLYATTDAFLRKFQIENLSMLPDYNEVMNRLQLIDQEYPRAGSDLFVKKAVSGDEELDKMIDEELRKGDEDNVGVEATKPEIAAAIDEDFEFEDEIPDYLIGEKYEIIE